MASYNGPNLTSYADMLLVAHQELVDTVVSQDFMQRFCEKHNKVKQVAEDWDEPFRLSASEGTGLMSAITSAYPAASAVKYSKMTGKTKTIAGTIKIWNQLEDRAKVDKYTYADAITEEIEGLQTSLKGDQDRYCIFDGGVTDLGKVTAATASGTTVTVHLDTTATLAVRSPKYLRIGMKIDFLTTAHALTITNYNKMEVSAILDDDSFTCTPDAASSAVDSAACTTLATDIQAATALIYARGGYAAEPSGFKSIMGDNDNTLWGIDRNTDAGAFFKPYLVKKKTSGSGIEQVTPTGTAQAWNLVDLHQFVAHFTKAKGVPEKNLVMAMSDATNTYLHELWRSNNETHTPGQIDAWSDEVDKFERIPIIIPPLMFDNAIVMIETTGLKKMELRKLDWRRINGQMWHDVAGYDAQQAHMVGSYEQVHKNPALTGWLGDLEAAY